MANSIVKICNAALISLGADTIMSLTEDSQEARLCNTRYEGVRDAVLRDANWFCAMTQATLAQLSAAPLFGYAYSYTLPTDPYCLRVVKLHEGETPTNYKWRVAGRNLETDSETATIDYIKRITDPNDMDSLLSEAISARLAMEIAYKITGNSAAQDKMIALFKAKMLEAMGANAKETNEAPATGSVWLTARS